MSFSSVQSSQGFTPNPPITPALRPRQDEEVKAVVGVKGKNDGDADDKKAVKESVEKPVEPTTNSQGQLIGANVNITA